DRLLELLLGGAEFLDVVRADQEQPVTLRLRRHSHDFGLEATRLLFVADGELHDLRGAVLLRMIVHGSCVSFPRCGQGPVPAFDTGRPARSYFALRRFLLTCLLLLTAAPACGLLSWILFRMNWS